MTLSAGVKFGRADISASNIRLYFVPFHIAFLLGSNRFFGQHRKDRLAKENIEW